MAESQKERTDRQLLELLNELRVALPGAQILLGFLFTVPFATRFGRVSHGDRIALLFCLLSTAAGTILLMAPSIYHRLRWEEGGKSDVIRIAHLLFLAGTACLGVGMIAAVVLITDVLFAEPTAAGCTAAVGLVVLATWYLMPLQRSRQPRIREEE